MQETEEGSESVFIALLRTLVLFIEIYSIVCLVKMQFICCSILDKQDAKNEHYIIMGKITEITKRHGINLTNISTHVNRIR